MLRGRRRQFGVGGDRQRRSAWPTKSAFRNSTLGHQAMNLKSVFIAAALFPVPGAA